MRNVGLEETQAGIKIAGRNINNLRYADDTTLMAESEEELKSLLMKLYGTFGAFFVALITVFLVLAIVSSFFPKQAFACPLNVIMSTQ